jgi:hypothetical protein
VHHVMDSKRAEFSSPCGEGVSSLKDASIRKCHLAHLAKARTSFFEALCQPPCVTVGRSYVDDPVAASDTRLPVTFTNLNLHARVMRKDKVGLFPT